jgi:hypothetical protein
MALVAETKELGPFTRIELQAYGELTIEPGEPGVPAVLTQEAEPPIMEKLKVEVRDGRLLLGYDLSWSEWVTWWLKWATLGNRKVTYHLKAAGIEAVRLAGTGQINGSGLVANQLQATISGSGNIKLEALKVQHLESKISGSGNIQASGEADEHDIKIAGSGNVRADGLETGTTRVTVSGSGSAWVHAKDHLEVKITGSGSVKYSGQPSTIEQQIRGSGKVQKLA